MVQFIRLPSFKQAAQGVRDYFLNTTVHGFRYVVEGNTICEKFSWFVIIIAGFVTSGVIVQQSFKSWDETPLQTTIEKVSVPIQNFAFPSITACDIDSMRMPRKNRWIFLEQLLNWIDLKRIQYDKDNIDTSLLGADPFQISSILKEISKVLDGSKDFHPNKNAKAKNCWDLSMFNEEYVHTCGSILEFLILGEYLNVSNASSDNLYESIIGYWRRNFMIFPTNFKHDKVDSYVMNQIMYPSYEQLFSKDHNSMKESLSTANFSELNKLQFYNRASCISNTYCTDALKKLVNMWDEIANLVLLTFDLVGRSNDPGGIVANFNFLLDTRSKRTNYSAMQKQISSIISVLYPDFLPNNQTFLVDVLSLLGYATDFRIDSWRDYLNNEEYNDLEVGSAILNSGYQVNQYPDKQARCNLDYLYEEWEKYLVEMNTPMQANERGNTIF